MEIRTDLALEKCENTDINSVSGVTSESFSAGNVKITRIEVTDKNGAKLIGKPIGKYITAETQPFAKHAQFIGEELEMIAKEISSLIPEEGSVLVAGLGNSSITPDALGPKCADMIFATRHIKGEILKETGLNNLRCVCAFSTGVLGNTGAEAGEIIKALVNQLDPSAVITIDALAARSIERLGNTVQMCSTGITPGSGVGNSRSEINEKTIGVPVIAIGVPTVVDAATLVSDFAGNPSAEYPHPGMMVTPREVDLMIEHAAKLTSLAINRALQPEISAEDLIMLTS
ncbi:MAG: GPR endopeptidase [Clostridia bacterium]|nr:GPR endopeptidase [Clostridia bacterium]